MNLTKPKIIKQPVVFCRRLRMFTLNKFSEQCNNADVSKNSFMSLLTSEWDRLHEETDIFRYKIEIHLEEKLLDGKYLLQLNPDRQAKRRIPQDIHSISQPFDSNKFNFTKISPEEVILSLKENDSDNHTFLVNVSPISKYHSLLCPSICKCLPQIVTAESMELAVQIMFVAQDRNIKIGFNSLCALASVNHLHYHLFVEKHTLAVEQMKWICLKDHIHMLDKEYPVPAFCFEVAKNNIKETSKDIQKLIGYFLEKHIAHNILLSRRRLECAGENVYVIVWPRKSTTGVKQLAAFNVAVLELSGWFPVYSVEDFNKLTTQDIENELKKWKYEDFDKLCDEIKHLY